MADKKISQFPVSTTVIVTDLVPIVSGGANKVVTVGTIALNMPNIGNNGITKNMVTAVTSTTIPLNKTILTLDSNIVPYTLGVGGNGQEIVLVALGACTVLSNSSYFTSLGMDADSSIVLVYVDSVSKWITKSSHNVVFT